MSRVALWIAILLDVATVAAAALIVLPAPNRSLAFAAIWMGEKSLFVVGLAIVAASLGLLAMRPGTRLAGTGVVLSSLVVVVVGMIPAAQALRLAGEHRVDLSLRRYLAAPVDTMGPIAGARSVTYATPGGRALRLDVYAPHAPAVAPSRALLVVHGGGWSSGDKGDASYASRWLAEQGFTVFDVEYRTGPSPIWKVAVADVKCAIGWVKGHALTADWNIDPANISLLGRSAGGHLVLLAAYTPGDERLPPSCDAPDTTVAAVAAYYAPTDLTWGYAHEARPAVYDSSERLRQFVGGPPETTGDLYRLLSPTERVTPAAPRTLLVHGGRDQFIGKQHVEMLADKLRSAQVRTETLIIPYAQHGFDFVFGGFSGQIAEAVLLRFLNTSATGNSNGPAPPPPARDGNY